ncbi:MAG: hypothetical protein Q6353_002260 [Candidatus Sigynarchaeum springense]
MLTDENRNKYMILLIGIAIGAMCGFVFAMFVSGSITQAWTWKIADTYNPPTTPFPQPPDPYVGIPRIDVFSTTLVGCIIAIAFALIYVYLVEWSKLGKARNATITTKGAE